MLNRNADNLVFGFGMAMLFAVAASALTGCKTLSSKPAANPPVVAGQTPTQSPTTSPLAAPPSTTPTTFSSANLPGKPSETLTGTSQQYQTYRPVSPESFFKPAPTDTNPVPVIVERRIESGNNSNNSVSGVNDAGIVSQAETEKLRQENEDLKTRLTESEKKSEELAKQVWEAEKNKIPPLKKTGAAESNAKSDQKPPVLPTINKQGVSVSLDDQNRIHIAVVDSVLFMPNTWQITADGEETLRTIAAEIKASHPKTFLDIEGHTDSLIGDPKNPTQKHGISAVKTMTVMDFFINSLKWDASNIRTSSFGSSRPVADNGTPEGRAKNNRVEIVVVDQ